MHYCDGRLQPAIKGRSNSPVDMGLAKPAFLKSSNLAGCSQVWMRGADDAPVQWAHTSDILHNDFSDSEATDWPELKERYFPGRLCLDLQQEPALRVCPCSTASPF